MPPPGTPPGDNPVVSTTSTLPSKWPTECPAPVGAHGATPGTAWRAAAPAAAPAGGRLRFELSRRNGLAEAVEAARAFDITPHPRALEALRGVCGRSGGSALLIMRGHPGAQRDNER